MAGKQLTDRGSSDPRCDHESTVKSQKKFRSAGNVGNFRESERLLRCQTDDVMIADSCWPDFGSTGEQQEVALLGQIESSAVNSRHWVTFNLTVNLPVL